LAGGVKRPSDVGGKAWEKRRVSQKSVTGGKERGNSFFGAKQHKKGGAASPDDQKKDHCRLTGRWMGSRACLKKNQWVHQGKRGPTHQKKSGKQHQTNNKKRETESIKKKLVRKKKSAVEKR